MQEQCELLEWSQTPKRNVEGLKRQNYTFGAKMPGAQGKGGLQEPFYLKLSTQGPGKIAGPPTAFEGPCHTKDGKEVARLPCCGQLHQLVTEGSIQCTILRSSAVGTLTMRPSPQCILELPTNPNTSLNHMGIIWPLRGLDVLG